MRIDRLKILSPWKNLEGLSIDFDQNRSIVALIGKNGSSKSNLLEAIILIFKQINEETLSEFAYEITYLIEKNKKDSYVSVICDSNSKPKATVNDEKISHNELKESWTPQYVIGYYSGTSDRFEDLFSSFDKQALQATTRAREDEKTLSFRRFVYARPIHGLFSLLAFYFTDDRKAQDFLREYARIEGFDSLLLKVKRPGWAKQKDKRAEDFWGARGPVRLLLDTLKKHSLGHLSIDNEFVYLFIPSIESLLKVSDEYGRDPKALFQAFDTMRLSDLIGDMQVRVKIPSSRSVIHSRQLSEGEQQLITVIGLLRFTRDENSLYLLDEPDTHLNPYWGVNYIEILKNISGIEKNSHTLIATHDPLLVAGLIKNEIRVLTRSSEGKIIASCPEVSPRGRGIANVLTSDLYGLESQLDIFSLNVLRQIYKVSDMKKGSFRDRYLEKLRCLVPALDDIEATPDPYRNIAKDAYKLAQANIVNSPLDSTKKMIMVRELSKKLYKESIDAVEEL